MSVISDTGLSNNYYPQDIWMRTVCSNGCGTENNYHIMSVDSGSVVLEAQIPMGAKH